MGLEQWATGQTGYPMVDACMRALLATSFDVLPVVNAEDSLGPGNLAVTRVG